MRNIWHLLVLCTGWLLSSCVIPLILSGSLVEASSEGLYVITTRPNGTLYEGEETELKHLQEVATTGESQAMMTLSSCYGYGWCKGIPKDAKLEFEWARKAAFAGHPEGMLNLGLAYRKGQFVSVHKPTSFAWMKLSLLRGYPDSTGMHQKALTLFWEGMNDTEKKTSLEVFNTLQQKIPKVKVTRIQLLTK
ncbi:MAG: tetratricopeptide repeat protein [Vampirovibrionales bacterium]